MFDLSPLARALVSECVAWPDAAGEDSVTAIAHKVGYTSLSAFNAAFRDLTGRTPTQYRATFRP